MRKFVLGKYWLLRVCDFKGWVWVKSSISLSLCRCSLMSENLRVNSHWKSSASQRPEKHFLSPKEKVQSVIKTGGRADGTFYLFLVLLLLRLWVLIHNSTRLFLSCVCRVRKLKWETTNGASRRRFPLWPLRPCSSSGNSPFKTLSAFGHFSLWNLSLSSEPYGLVILISKEWSSRSFELAGY